MIPKLESIGRPSISESIQEMVSGMMGKFSPMNLAKGLINRNPDKNEINEKESDKLTPLENNTKIGKVDTGLFTTIASGTFQKVRVSDGAATVATKYYSLFDKKEKDNKLKFELESDFEKEKTEETKRKFDESLKEIDSISSKSTSGGKPSSPSGSGISSKSTSGGKPSSPSGSGISSKSTSGGKPFLGKFKKTTLNAGRGIALAGAAGYGAYETNKLISRTASPERNDNEPKDEQNKKTLTRVSPVSTEGVSKLLERGESSNYEQLVIGKGGGDLTGKFNKKALTDMSVGEVRDLQKKMISSGKFPSSALGKYQIIGETLQGAIDQGIVNSDDKFDKNTQDKLFKTYLIGSKRKSINEFISGRSDNIEQAQMELAQEFASVGVPRKVSKGEFGKYPVRDLQVGESLYAGVAGNKARISPEQSAAALMYDRIAQQKESPKIASAENTGVKSGNKLYSETSSNLDSKRNVSSVSVNNPTKNVLGRPPKSKIITGTTLMDTPYVASFVTPMAINPTFLVAER
jgi:hypothetical protein